VIFVEHDAEEEVDEADRWKDIEQCVDLTVWHYDIDGDTTCQYSSECKPVGKTISKWEKQVAEQYTGENHETPL